MSNLSTFAIYTLGCKVNLYESNAARNELLAEGLIEVPFTQKADVYIINTCSVTSRADAKSKNIMNRPKKINPDAIVIVMGCFTQTSSQLANEWNVDIVIGNKHKNSMMDLINEFQKSNKKLVKVENLMSEKEFEDSKISSFKENTRAFIKIQDGCNFMCSYCIIPFSRGRQRSKDLGAVIKEVNDLVDSGYKEIVLTGVNTAGYLDNNGNDFLALIKALDELKKDFRVRISSIEPFQISDEIISIISNDKNKFCQHWHLCLQSASDSVLEKMNRKYTFKEFKSIIDKIKKHSPNATFTTDYIVGFPTESDEDHKQSINNIKQINFFDMHVFPYSPRSGTAASRLKRINGKIVNERFEEVEKTRKEMQQEVLNNFVGEELDVLFENEQNGFWHGHSSEYITVLVKSNENLKNQLLKVKINAKRIDFLVGEIK